MLKSENSQNKPENSSQNFDISKFDKGPKNSFWHLNFILDKGSHWEHDMSSNSFKLKLKFELKTNVCYLYCPTQTKSDLQRTLRLCMEMLCISMVMLKPIPKQVFH